MSIEEKTKPYHGKGYILKIYKAPKIVYDYVWSLTKGAKDQKKRRKYHKFISHILANMYLNSKELIKNPEKDYFVPIYSRLIDKNFGRDFNWNILKKHKLLEILPHSIKNHVSREFRIPNNIFDSFVKKMDCILDPNTSVEGLDFVNLMTGKKVETKSNRYQLSHGTKNFNIPSIIKESIKSIQPGPIDLQNAKKWVKRMKRKYDHEKDLFEKRTKKCKSGRCYKKHLKEFKTHRGRYYSDLSSLTTILANTPTKTGKIKKNGHPIYLVKASYRSQKSGRLFEIGGGFQSASRAMKYVSIVNIPVYNYDIKSSQGFILKQEMEKYRIKCGWLQKYLERKDAKNIYADKTGITVDLWKECFYALIMGAEAPNKKGAIYKTIASQLGIDRIRANVIHKRFLSVTADLRKATREWRETLFSDPIKQHISMYNDCLRWKNACGMIFRDYSIGKKEDPENSLVNDTGKKSNDHYANCKRKLAAFMLQGQEALFIHRLTVLCSKSNIPVYRNEHDGIITGKKIPPKIIETARIESGFKEADIVIKQICSDSEFEERLNYIKIKTKKKKKVRPQRNSTS
ncbi:hypothetical protein [Desulfobacula sp.]|uniref:hypothetical protein n=1 Tax=Desulfobacula sp. TaxID=2593537 RepID=UPI002632A48D|nr:hypothetical protein [Desulfobacula sp.]